MIPPKPPDIPRDDFGRPLIVPPGGGAPAAYQRTTTFSGALEQLAGVHRWEMRGLAAGLGKRPDLGLIASGCDPTSYAGKQALDGLIEQVAQGFRTAAPVGTELHRRTELIDRGEDVGFLPAPFAADLRAYAEATRDIEWTAVETFRVYDPWRVAGTADRIGRYRGALVIADIKTGKTVDYPTKFALQLAMYSRSVSYDPATGARGLPETGLDLTRGLIIHLPAGQGVCTLHWIDIEKGWKLCQLAKQVWDARAVRGLLQPVSATTTFADRARTAPDIEALRDLWREAHAHNAIDENFTAMCGKRREQLAAT